MWAPVWESWRTYLSFALVGAILGAMLAYAVATGNPRSVLRRLVTSACGVLAQFGGVTLAFAFDVITGGPEVLDNVATVLLVSVSPYAFTKSVAGNSSSARSRTGAGMRAPP